MIRQRSPLRQLSNSTGLNETFKKIKDRSKLKENEPIKQQTHPNRANDLHRVFSMISTLSKITQKKVTINFKDFFWHIYQKYAKSQTIAANIVKCRRMKRIVQVFKVLRSVGLHKNRRNSSMVVVRHTWRYQQKAFHQKFLKRVFLKWKEQHRDLKHKRLADQNQMVHGKLQKFVLEMQKTLDKVHEFKLENQKVSDALELIPDNYDTVVSVRSQLRSDSKIKSINKDSFLVKSEKKKTIRPKSKETSGAQTARSAKREKSKHTKLHTQQSFTKISTQQTKPLPKTKSLQKFASTQPQTERKSLTSGKVTKNSILQLAAIQQAEGACQMSRSIEKVQTKNFAHSFEQMKELKQREIDSRLSYENQQLGRVFYEWCTTVRNYDIMVSQLLKQILLRKAFKQFKSCLGRKPLVSFGGQEDPKGENLVSRVNAWLLDNQEFQMS